MDSSRKKLQALPLVAALLDAAMVDSNELTEPSYYLQTMAQLMVLSVQTRSSLAKNGPRMLLASTLPWHLSLHFPSCS